MIIGWSVGLGWLVGLGCDFSPSGLVWCGGVVFEAGERGCMYTNCYAGNLTSGFLDRFSLLGFGFGFGNAVEVCL